MKHTCADIILSEERRREVEKEEDIERMITESQGKRDKREELVVTS
jgi:hypothetical protein